jgi:hypothetical protein
MKSKSKFHKEIQEGKKPFHPSKVTLTFRFAFFKYIYEYMPDGYYRDALDIPVTENPFERELGLLKARLGNFSIEDQFYWDVLYDLNMRDKSLPTIMEESQDKDPDKEAWIQKELKDPNGLFKEKVKYYYRDTP